MSNKTFRGKFLLRNSKTASGKDCIVMVGVCFPNKDTDKIEDTDEMWVGDISFIGDGIKFKKSEISFNQSPEDWLNGEGMSPNSWGEKEKF